MTTEPKTVTEIMAKHPVPWRYLASGGNVQMLDAAGVEVSLFTMLDVAVLVSHMVAGQNQKAAAASAAQAAQEAA